MFNIPTIPQTTAALARAHRDRDDELIKKCEADLMAARIKFNFEKTLNSREVELRQEQREALAAFILGGVQ